MSGRFTKKYYIGLLAIAIVTFIGFQFYKSNNRPSDINEDLYNDTISIIKILDNYLDGNIDIGEAEDRIDKINYESHIDKDNVNEYSIGMRIDLLKIGLTSFKSDSDIQQTRNDLAKVIHYKK